MQWFASALDNVLGKLEACQGEFTNCGVHHIQDPRTWPVKLDQVDYIKAFKPVVHEDLKTSVLSPLSSSGWTRYLSLLGAVAFATLTRHDVAVYVSALQRAAHKATTIHLKRLNA